jgi:hypothetical protein
LDVDDPVIGRTKIPQRSSLLPYSGVLSFLSETREHRAMKRRDFIALIGSERRGR